MSDPVPASPPQPVPGALIQHFAPDPQERTTQHVPVDADPGTSYAAIRSANLVNVPVTRILSEVAWVPVELAARLRRGRNAALGHTAHLEDMLADDSPWTLLDEEPGVELVLGILWKPPSGAERRDAGEFAAFSEPGIVKVAWSHSVIPYGTGSLLVAETRTVATDATARRRFGAVWPVVGPFAAVARRGVLQAMREHAETAASS